MQHLSSNSKNNPPDQHQPKRILEPSEPEHHMSSHAESSSDDKDNPGSILVDEYSSEKWDDNVGKGV